VAAVTRRVRRYWWVVILVGFVGSCLAVAGALLRKPLYRSEAVLQYREVIRQEVLYGQDQQRDRGDVTTRLQEAALARNRLREIIDMFELYPDIVKDERKGYVVAIEEMKKRIEFKSKGGDVFYVAYLGESKEQAYQVTQRLAEALIEDEKVKNAEEVTATKDFLESELETASKALNEAIFNASKFLEKHPEFALDTFNMSAPGASIRAEARKELNQQPIKKTTDPQLNSLFREEARLIQKMRDLERKGAQPALVGEKDRASQELSDARSNLDTMRRRFTDQHPDVLAAQARMSAAQRNFQRAEEAVNRDIARNKDPQQEAAKGELAKVQAQIRDRKIQLDKEKTAANAQKTPAPTPAPTAATAPQATPEPIEADPETQWSELYREVERARERYKALESKQFIADIDAKVEVRGRSPLSFIDRAYLPNRPAGASRTLMVIAGGLVSGFLGIGIAILLALIDDRLFNRREVEKLGILPVLVVVPREAKRRRGKKAAALDY
jgi:hypothetical protein